MSNAPRTKLEFAFNGVNFDPTQGGGNLPVGRGILFRILNGEVKGNSAGTGGFVELRLRSEDPRYPGEGSTRFNMYSASEKAANFAHRQFSAFSQCALGAPFQGDDIAALFGRMVRADVEYQDGHAPGSSEDAKGYTEVKRWFTVNGEEPIKGGFKHAFNPAELGNAPAATSAPAASTPANTGGFGGGQQQQQQAQGGWGNNAGQQQQQQQQPEQPAQQGGWGNQNPNAGQQQPQGGGFGQQQGGQPASGGFGQQAGGQAAGGWGNQGGGNGGGGWGQQQG